MIASLTGTLRSVNDDRVILQVGGFALELLVPPADLDLLQSGIGQEITFHTIAYLEGDAARGNLEPRLIGFLRPQDKRFFELFTTVKGIGPIKALRALGSPIADIARAIESRDTRTLSQLKGIGRRSAELMIAELAGKVTEFAGPAPATAIPAATRRRPVEEDAIEAMIALGERRADAEQLLERVKTASTELNTTAALLNEMLRLRTVRA